MAKVTEFNNLAVTHLELAKEYHPTMNLLPAHKVLGSTYKRFWWKCSEKECGHEWKVSGRHRAEGSGCPACSGRVASKRNNLLLTHPELAKEYHSTKNALPADKVIAGTNKKLWWKCSEKECGHEWETTGAVRVRGSGCPACSNKVVTDKNNLAVTHPDLAKEYHPIKNRLPAHRVIAGTHKKLWWICSKPGCGYEWRAVGHHRVMIRCCPACTRQVVTEKNNLAVCYPELAKEYHPTKNDLPPNKVIAGGSKKLWWICSKPTCGHEWRATGGNRTAGTGCPACRGLVVTEKNNLALTHPELAKEYHPTKNILPASQVLAGTQKNLWWICSKVSCRHEWRTKGSARVHGTGCPRCNMWGIQGYRKDLKEIGLNHRFRSSWEANIARLLHFLNHPVLYEKTIIRIGKRRYTPDFRITRPLPFVLNGKDGDFLEVKGDSFIKDKQNLMIDQTNCSLTSDIRIHMIKNSEYRKIEKEYSNLIPLWEKDGFNLRTHPEIFDPNYKASNAA